jgi:hypothetical protein
LHLPGPSTRNLELLASIAELRCLLQSVAMLDAILCPEWHDRYYSFNASWAPGEMMGSMRNGQGDDFFFLVNAKGCFLKGFDHESEIRAARLPSERFYIGLPAELGSCKLEPAFSPHEVTFCAWRLTDDAHWSRTEVITGTGDFDGSERLLAILGGRPETYQTWATEYYERDVSLRAVTAIYEHATLTDALVQSLNANCDPAALAKDVFEISYPMRL